MRSTAQRLQHLLHHRTASFVHGKHSRCCSTSQSRRTLNLQRKITASDFIRPLSTSSANSPLSPFPSFPPHKLPPLPPPVLDHKDDRKYKKYITLPPKQRIIMLGFGAIGQGVLPLLFRHIKMEPNQLLIIADQFTDTSRSHAKGYGVETIVAKLTHQDYKDILNKHIKKGDFLINVSVDVSSIALIEHCQVR